MNKDNMNQDQKAKQKLWQSRSSRGNRRYVQPQSIPVLHPEVLARVNALPAVKRMLFLRTLHGIESLYPIGKEREILLRTLLQKLFITSATQSGVSQEIVSKEETERSV